MKKAKAYALPLDQIGKAPALVFTIGIYYLAYVFSAFLAEAAGIVWISVF